MNVTVRRGDCLWSIAQSHGVSLKALIAANPQIKNPSMIHAGQTVHLPGDGFEKQKPQKPPPPAKPSPSRPATTAREYQKHAIENPKSIFKTQYRSPYNPTGPLKSSNCGPASLAMAIKAYGLEPHGLTPEQSIDRARKLMTGNTNDHDPTSDRERENGARAAGLHAKHLGSMKHLDDELGDGHMVMVTGDPGEKYKDVFAHYSNFKGLHSILVVGKTKDGHYVVCDPVSHSGPRLMTQAEMKSFWHDGGGSGTAVWR